MKNSILIILAIIVGIFLYPYVFGLFKLCVILLLVFMVYMWVRGLIKNSKIYKELFKNETK